MPTPPRGTLVLDIGSTNTKLVLFAGDGRPLRERRAESRHVPGPPYPSLDPEPALKLLEASLPEFDAALPVDVIVPCAHGSALALLDEAGALALPVMDYLAEPPAEVVAAYRRIAPPFSEVFSPLNPMALTLGLQLFWQQTAFPEAFARVRTILPWGQYFAYRLTGSRGDRLHRARRADAARRRDGQQLFLAREKPRLGQAVRTTGAALRHARRAEVRTS
jgi:sugar (pentulose or hexulose) kinase